MKRNDFEINIFLFRCCYLHRYRNDSIENLLEQLPLSKAGGFTKCIPFEKLSVEIIVYWLALVEYIQQTDTNEDEEDQLQYVICELSTFCEYLTEYINYIRETPAEDPESWDIQEDQYRLCLLIEILLRFDLGDEIGRQNLNTFVSKVLSTQILGENIVQKLVHCVENLITDLDARLQYFIDIIRGIIDPCSSIDVSDPSIAMLLDNIKDPEKKLKIGHLKLEIMDLREQESELSKNKDYIRLEKVIEDLAARNEEFLNLLNTCSDSMATSTTISELNSNTKKVSKEWTLHCLEICFYAVCSKQTTSLTPNMFKLYEDFVQRHMKSQHMEIRDRALTCGIACSMLYEHLAKDVHQELYLQFVRHHQPRLWTTAVNGICEMFDRYGIEFFAFDMDTEKSDGSKTKKTRQLYNATLEQDDPEESTDASKNGTNVMYLFAHLFDTCQESAISMALATGFCRLILGGHYETNEIISKILLKFFNPSTCTEISQILSVFFETLIQRGKQICLEKALLPTIFTILDAPNESPLREIKPDLVIKFVINSTMPSANDTGPNIHANIAKSFLNQMFEQTSNKELLKVLSKELQTLVIESNKTVRDELLELANNLLEESINDNKIEGYIKSFIDMLSGVSKRSQSSANLDENGSDEDPELIHNEMNENNENAATHAADNSIQTGDIDSTIVDKTDQHMENAENIDSTNQSDEENFVSSASRTSARNRQRRQIKQKTNAAKAVQSTSAIDKQNSVSDENENEKVNSPANCLLDFCRVKFFVIDGFLCLFTQVVTSTQEQSDDDEMVPNTPTTPVSLLYN